jgi:predicted nucleotide-binding protein
MSQINQQLLERLSSKLNVGKAQVYSRIQAVAGQTMLDRHLAALVLASQVGVNIQKYSTPAERATIRGSLNSGASHSSPAAVDDPIERPPKKAGKLKKVSKVTKAKDNSVFVVHGRNDGLRKSMFEFLRALGLKPLEWEKALLMAKGVNPHIDDILDTAMAKVQAVVVLFSPDDEARLKNGFWKHGDGASEKQLRGQPRPNVIFEAGLALGRHPEKTLLVQVGAVRGFTDIAGKHLVRLNNDYAKRNDLANRLKKIGCTVDRDGTDWTKAGDFTA